MRERPTKLKGDLLSSLPAAYPNHRHESLGAQFLVARISFIRSLVRNDDILVAFQRPEDLREDDEDILVCGPGVEYVVAQSYGLVELLGAE